VQATMQISQASMTVIRGETVRPGLEQIFLSHKDLIFRAAYRITGNASDAEDVLQTVFLRLVRQEDISAINNLPGYLHRSAVNAALDLLRSRKDAQTVSLDADPHQMDAVSLDTAARVTELRDWLRQALARLNPRWAEMFVLRFVEDLSNREIAGLMKTSPAVVAVVLHRTRALLKKDFKSVKARGTR
jgi:RNA polymerase sigma-70 factor (ECF subfamily)